MDFLYSLYDALVSINVPGDKARAVVDAMERDMGTTLATKVDLSGCATREDVVALRGEIQGVRQDIAAVRQDVAAVKQDVDSRFALLRQELDTTRKLLAKDIEAMRSSIVIWLGSAIVVAAGIIVAGMRVF